MSFVMVLVLVPVLLAYFHTQYSTRYIPYSVHHFRMSQMQVQHPLKHTHLEPDYLVRPSSLHATYLVLDPRFPASRWCHEKNPIKKVRRRGDIPSFIHHLQLHGENIIENSEDSTYIQTRRQTSRRYNYTKLYSRSL
jgi:hypothetical protein